MKEFLIEIRKELCIEKQVVFQKSSLKEALIADGYGEKRFITELGEVAYINFFENGGIPESMQDISNYFVRVNENRKKKSIFRFELK
ncbi:hypothetical protein [Larkinella rosea]|uniref:Uncharacterized protein n=1 Tax=Larkinella rosea TaxID=2025312 RepID=A0A3P1BP15_9BACT|nr:hypothetical protein [Larkinella rosea]RRB02837.1 hypothetical protein EHT25_20580 [Larkinella rosea]